MIILRKDNENSVQIVVTSYDNGMDNIGAVVMSSLETQESLVKESSSFYHIVRFYVFFKLYHLIGFDDNNSQVLMTKSPNDSDNFQMLKTNVKCWWRLTYGGVSGKYQNSLITIIFQRFSMMASEQERDISILIMKLHVSATFRGRIPYGVLLLVS